MSARTQADPLRTCLHGRVLGHPCAECRSQGEETDAIGRSLRRIEALRNACLQSVERVRGFHGEADRVRIADLIANTYGDVIRVLREERAKL